jgi:hypothetical protein
MESQGSKGLTLQLYSDTRGALSGTATASLSSSPTGTWQRHVSLSFLWKASKTVTVSFSPSFTRVHQLAQYVNAVTDPYAQATYGRRYIFATLDQTQLAASFRLNWTFTPKLSLQLFMQPLLSTGEYTDLKELAQPRTFSFRRYGGGGGFSALGFNGMDSSTISLQDNYYTIDPDAGGPARSFQIYNPNFNYKSLRLNAVLRWEYLPGSTLYLVWTNEKLHYETSGIFELRRDFRTLLRDRPDNVLALKLTYWWSR